MTFRTALPFSMLALILTLSAAPAQAQFVPALPVPAPLPAPGDATGAGPGQVLSANPFGLLIDWFNSEYEIRATDSITFGAGASTRHTTVYDYDAATYQSRERRERYINGDAFVRYYPKGRVFNGWSFGVKSGFTHIPTQGSYFGVGVDTNQSWMMNDHFYMGYGFGLKRLIGANDHFDLKYVPTFRMNVGLGF